MSDMQAQESESEFTKSRDFAYADSPYSVMVSFSRTKPQMYGDTNVRKEKRPLCGGCSRIFPELSSCVFEPHIQLNSTARIKPPPTHARRPIQIQPRPGIPAPISIHPARPAAMDHPRALEMRLMHHYVTETSAQLPEGKSAHGAYCWSMDVPRLAFHSELVLNALLGISAIHHSALSPEDLELPRAAGVYFNKAIQQHRMALRTVDRDTAETVLATAILICHHSWIAAHNKASGQPYEIPKTYYMARGIMALSSQMRLWLTGSGYLWYVDQSPNTNTILPVSHTNFMLSCEKDIQDLSITFHQRGTSTDDILVYEAAVKELQVLYHGIEAKDPQIHSLLATMPLRVANRFLELLELKEPRALALLARNMALIEMIPWVWWLHGVKGTQPVARTAIEGLTSLLPSVWMWTMKWPERVIAGEFSSNGELLE